MRSFAAPRLVFGGIFQPTAGAVGYILSPLRGFVRAKVMCTIVGAELHWFEAHGIGKRKMKLKRVLKQYE